MKKGSLVIAGTGIKSIQHITLEAKMYMENAEKLIYLVADPLTSSWIKDINPDAESLYDCYSENKPRIDSYIEMIDRILQPVRNGLDVCAIFYGHPGVFVYPSHEVIKKAKAEGYSAKMLAGISAEDCLFADLGIDPGKTGCQSFEATDLLVHKRKFDITSPLILWQIGMVGNLGFKPKGYDKEGLNILVDFLKQSYSGDHEVIVYEASQYSVTEPIIQHIKLNDLLNVKISPICTLFIPQANKASLDHAMIKRLGMDLSSLFITKDGKHPNVHTVESLSQIKNN